MTQEHKDILLKDLCARLPYKVKINIPDMWNSTKTNIEVLEEIFCGDDGNYRCNDSGMLIDYCKPYLFPLSSMTDEQIMHAPDSIHVSDLEDLRYDSKLTKLNSCFTDLIDLIDWLNKNHFDYRGLIPMGLANDATGKNIY